MRSLKALISLSFLLASACGKDSSNRPKVPLLYSPSAPIPGGLGIDHKVKLMPEGSPEVERGEAIPYPKVEGRRPVKIEIDHAGLFKVTEQKCEEGVCTLSYSQKVLGEATEPQINYHLVDESGYSWVAGFLAVKGQMPRYIATAFTPAFGETVRLTLPLADQTGAPLQYTPKVTQSGALGGTLKSLNCTQEACTLDFLYDQFQQTPVINFSLEGPVYAAKHSILPQAEEVTIPQGKMNVFGSPATVRLVHGVDYTSSWKRPAPYISIVDYKGMDRPYFQCSADSCLSTVRISNNKDATFTWSTQGAPQKARMDLTVVDADVKPMLKEVVLDPNVKTLVTLQAGVDYTGAEGALATALDIEQSAWIYGLSISDVRCDTNGTCSFNVSYNGTEVFVTRNYNLKVGNYKSPSQILKIMPRIAPSTDKLELWDRMDEYQELVLEAGKDYQTQDGSKATAIIVNSDSNLAFRDVPSLNDSNRSQVFQCDDQGNCRAWVRNRKTFTSSPSFYYAVKTATGTSVEVRRTLLFKSDDIKVLTEKSLARSIGKTVDQHADRMDFALTRDVDYKSIFPAEKLLISPMKRGLTLAGATEANNGDIVVPCDDAGRCHVQGHFRSDVGYLDLKLTLVNKYGKSSVINVRLIREQFAFMTPNLDTIKLAANGTEEFDVKLKQGPGMGYDAGIRARRLQVESPYNNLLSGTASEGSDMLEYPCADDGSCTFRIRAVRGNTQVQYRFLDDEGHVSFLNNLTVNFPDMQALSTNASVPAEVNQVTVTIPYANPDYQTNLLLETQNGIKATQITRDYDGYKVVLSLEKPLVAGQDVALPFVFEKEGKRSNKALLTLKPFQPLSLKPDLVVPAKKESDGTWTVTLKYSDHFQALPADTRVQFYFINRLTLTLESHLDILPPTMQCNRQDACTWNFVKVEGSPLTQIKGKLRYNEPYSPSGYYLKEGTFTITF